MKWRRIITRAGGRFLGVQDGTGRIPDHALFLDPKTGATLALPLDQITVRTVTARIEDSRRKFGRRV